MKNILLVDDDIDIIDLVSSLLTRNNFIAKAITGGTHIFEVIKDFSPHLILLDISLGTEDGREICKRIKQAKETRNIPIILFSAHNDLINHIKGYLSNASLAKPFATSELLDTIRKYIA
ncbi:response regulator [Ginsengibacter hankyongi]|uniref:Response regulator n=1 Tax=Ginsengibacter hankyongi TaxID=2607284 RepID=A0A5J5IKA3_9BACT|nr:response regulator [Ginsengibacter hankyongi]KAA9040803.1 response regulator [Ginsengibacter hankyongi]